MNFDDRWYIWIPPEYVDDMRNIGAAIGSAGDDGRILIKLRAEKQSDLRPLPPGSTIITRPDNERANRNLNNVHSNVTNNTINIRAQQALEE
jgi:hypothetical protein